jgi:hypothetical protein
LNGRATGTATSDSFAVTASAPLEKNSPRTDLGTLDGFANNATLKLRWTRFAMSIANARHNPRDRAIGDITRANCRTQAGGKPDALKECDGPMSDELVGKYAPELFDEYLSLGFPNKPAFAFGLEGSVGYRKFEFLDPVTLAKGSDEKMPWGVKLFGSIFPGPSLTSITGAFEYQSAYEEHKASTVCPVDVTATFVKCTSGSLGGPDHKKKALGSLELRHMFIMPEGAFLKSLGVSAQVTHDFNSDVTGFDLPLYLIPDAKGNLLGGLRFGYRTDTDDLAVGVFVGSAFSFR